MQSSRDGCNGRIQKLVVASERQLCQKYYHAQQAFGLHCL